MPSANVHSLLTVKDDALSTNAAADVGKTLVGDLDKVAEEFKNAEHSSATSVIVSMTVEGKDEEAAPNSDDIKSAAKSKTLEYLEIELTKTVTTTSGGIPSSTTDPITTTNSLLTIIIPFDFTGKDRSSVAVYRYHDSSVDILGTTENNDKEKIELGTDSITLKVKKFSTYAIGYEKSSSDATYAPTVIQPGHGMVTVNPQNPGQGEKVTVTLTPDPGYQANGLKSTGVSRWQSASRQLSTSAETGWTTGNSAGLRRS